MGRRTSTERNVKNEVLRLKECVDVASVGRVIRDRYAEGRSINACAAVVL
jgi:hypothetical protein